MPFVIIVSLGIIMLAGLVVDGGRQLNAKGRGIAYAQEAARAGAQAVNVADPRLDLLPSEAVQVANTYCRQAMAKDAQLVSCDARITRVNDQAGSFRAVAVTARVQVPAILLGIVKHPLLSATGRALARPVSGITEGASGKQQTIAPPSFIPPGGSPPTAQPSPGVTVIPCTPKPVPPTPKPSNWKPPKPNPKIPECSTPPPGSQ